MAHNQSEALLAIYSRFFREHVLNLPLEQIGYFFRTLDTLAMMIEGDTLNKKIRGYRNEPAFDDSATPRELML